MPTRLFTCICSMLVLAMLAFACGDAEAARLGGGRSFGGKPSMSKPFTSPAPSSTAPAMSQQTNRQMPGAAAAAPASRGLFGGMGGMLGGLLAGGLIGSMLFGGGFSGGGFLDIILIAGLLYLAFKFFSRRKAASQSTAQGVRDGNATTFDAFRGGAAEDTVNQRSTPKPAPTQKGGFDWDALTSAPAGAAASTSVAVEPGTPRLPEGFDEEEFLRGAKAAYARLNTAWDKRDLNDIAQFSTPAFLAEIRQQAEEDKTPGTTELMLVNASIVELENVGEEQIIQVYFTVLLREDPTQDTPTEIREVWHFVRPLNGSDSWKLDGIQQVENM